MDTKKIGAFLKQCRKEKNLTQEQLAEIIQYAAQRNIEVIPELDIPGHTVAILAAYPELGCTHTDTLPKIVGKTTDLMLCANNEKVYSVYQDIIKSNAFTNDSTHCFSSLVLLCLWFVD